MQSFWDHPKLPKEIKEAIINMAAMSEARRKGDLFSEIHDEMFSIDLWAEENNYAKPTWVYQMDFFSERGLWDIITHVMPLEKYTDNHSDVTSYQFAFKDQANEFGDLPEDHDRLAEIPWEKCKPSEVADFIKQKIPALNKLNPFYSEVQIYKGLSGFKKATWKRLRGEEVPDEEDDEEDDDNSFELNIDYKKMKFVQ